jgi:[ribosomal protein S5]-alanine N-acetyltransferase
MKLKKMVENDFSLKGNKIVLKPFLVADINDFYISWLNNQEIVKFSNQRFLVHTRFSCLDYQASFENTDNLFISIRRLSDDSLIGTLTAYIASHHGTVDMGIIIGDQSIWGMGYGLDAWVTMSNWLLGRKNVRKITAGTLACNHGMIKLMERSGMILEATRKAQEIVDGRPVDMLHYAQFHGN